MISILLAAYNGAAFIRPQIRSILEQTEPDFRLFIRDDGSADSTWDILEEFAGKHPDRVFIERGAVNSGSAKAAFWELLQRHEDDYLMFCDQDDVWLPDKIETTLAAMRRAEAEAGKDVPLLAHTDLTVTDRDLRPIAPSFFDYQGLDRRALTLNRLLCQNNVTGCAMMINRALRRKLPPQAPPGMLMHDWWIALTAAAFGKIVFVDKPAVLYRQHGGNQLGAVNYRSVPRMWGMLRQRAGMRGRVSATFDQAREFYRLYGDGLPSAQRECLLRYLDIPREGKLRRAADLLRYRYTKQSLPALIGQLLVC